MMAYYCSSVVLMLLIATVDALHMNRLSLSEYQASPVLDKPVVIENALGWRQCQYWWKHILTRSLHEDMDVDREGVRQQLPLQTATRLVMQESSHEDPIYVSSPGSSCSTDQLPFCDLLDSLFDYKLQDWMPLFSLHAPITDSLVLAGEGASCTLQRHPYTSFSLGLMGNQIWRLIPPTDIPLSKSLESVAWDGYTFSTGECVKDGDLFGLLRDDMEGKRNAAVDDGDKLSVYQKIADQPDMIQSTLSVDAPRTSTVVMDGDVLIIPPNWWYQSYGLERSVSLKSQRCHNLSQFLQHIVQASKLEHVAPSDILERLNYEYASPEDAKQTIDELFALMEAQVQEPSKDPPPFRL